MTFRCAPALWAASVPTSRGRRTRQPGYVKRTGPTALSSDRPRPLLGPRRLARGRRAADIFQWSKSKISSLTICSPPIPRKAFVPAVEAALGVSRRTADRIAQLFDKHVAPAARTEPEQAARMGSGPAKPADLHRPRGRDRRRVGRSGLGRQEDLGDRRSYRDVSGTYLGLLQLASVLLWVSASPPTSSGRHRGLTSSDVTDCVGGTRPSRATLLLRAAEQQRPDRLFCGARDRAANTHRVHSRWRHRRCRH